MAPGSSMCRIAIITLLPFVMIFIIYHGLLYQSITNTSPPNGTPNDNEFIDLKLESEPLPSNQFISKFYCGTLDFALHSLLNKLTYLHVIAVSMKPKIKPTMQQTNERRPPIILKPTNINDSMDVIHNKINIFYASTRNVKQFAVGLNCVLDVTNSEYTIPEAMLWLILTGILSSIVNSTKYITFNCTAPSIAPSITINNKYRNKLQMNASLSYYSSYLYKQIGGGILFGSGACCGFEVIKYHKLLLKHLLNIVKNKTEEIQVKERALTAIEMFIDAYDPQDDKTNTDEFKIEMYLNDIMAAVMSILININTGNNVLVQQSLSTVSSCAQAASVKQFIEYLPQVGNIISTCLNVMDETKLEIRSEATACLGTIIDRVGIEIYEPIRQPLHQLIMDGLYDFDNCGLRESTFLYFSQLANIMGDNILNLENDGFEQIFSFILFVLSDDDGLQVELPDDGFDDIIWKCNECIIVILFIISWWYIIWKWCMLWYMYSIIWIRIIYKIRLLSDIINRWNIISIIFHSFLFFLSAYTNDTKDLIKYIVGILCGNNNIKELFSAGLYGAGLYERFGEGLTGGVGVSANVFIVIFSYIFSYIFSGLKWPSNSHDNNIFDGLNDGIITALKLPSYDNNNKLILTPSGDATGTGAIGYVNKGCYGSGDSMHSIGDIIEKDTVKDMVATIQEVVIEN